MRLARAYAMKEHDLDRIFIEVIQLIPADWASMKLLAEEADCSAQTLWNWAYGPTKNPQISTLCRVCAALGYEFILRRTHRPNLKVIPGGMK